MSNDFQTSANLKIKGIVRSVEAQVKLRWTRAHSVGAIAIAVLGYVAIAYFESSTSTPAGKTRAAAPTVADPSTDVTHPALVLDGDEPTVRPEARMAPADEYKIALMTIGAHAVTADEGVPTSPTAVASVTVAVTPPPPRDLKLGAWLRWGSTYDYHFVSMATRSPQEPQLFTFPAVKFRAPTVLGVMRATLRVVLAPDPRGTGGDESPLIMARAAVDFAVRVPAPIVQLTHACAKPVATESHFPQCSPLTLSGTSTYVLGSDDEKLCIEAVSSLKSARNVTLLYGSASERGWTATAVEESESMGGRYTFRYALVAPSHDGQICGVPTKSLALVSARAEVRGRN